MKLGQISERNIRIFFATEFCRSLYFTIPIWIAFLQERITTSEIAVYVAMVFLVQLLLELPTGAFADLVGRRVTLIFANFLDAIQIFLFGFAWLFPQFIILAVIAGVAEALRSGSLEALVYDSLKQDGKENTFRSVMARQALWFQGGLITASLLGGYIAAIWMPLPFILCAIFMIVAGVLAFAYVEPTIDSEKFNLRNYLRQIKWGAKEAFKTARHRYMSLYYIAIGSISWMCATYFNDFILIDLGFSAEMRGVISALLRVVNVLIIYKLLRNEKIFDFRNTIIFFPFLMIFSLIPGYVLQGWWGIPFVGGAMLASTARWVLLGKYSNQTFDSKYRATAISTLSMAIGIIYVIGIILSGPIMERWGDTRLVFTLLGILSLLTIPPLAYKILQNWTGKNS